MQFTLQHPGIANIAIWFLLVTNVFLGNGEEAQEIESADVDEKNHNSGNILIKCDQVTIISATVKLICFFFFITTVRFYILQPVRIMIDHHQLMFLVHLSKTLKSIGEKIMQERNATLANDSRYFHLILLIIKHQLTSQCSIVYYLFPDSGVMDRVSFCKYINL